MQAAATNLAVAFAALLFAASPASGFALEIRVSPSSDGYPDGGGWVVAPSELAIVDVYLDAEPGLQIVTVGVMFDDLLGMLTYQPGPSSMPSYILYTPGAGAAAASWMIPYQDPPQYWLGYTPPGKLQINVGFQSRVLVDPVAASGSEIWIGTLVFHVSDTLEGLTADVELVLGPVHGAALIVYDNDVSASTTVSGDVRFVVPEPEVAVLVGVGVLGLAVLARRGPR